LFLRGAVAGLLLFHLLTLALHGALPAVRLALAGLTLSVLAYLFCQQPETLLNLPRSLALLLLSLCVATSAWLWVAARALFDDAFAFNWPIACAIVALTALGLAANLPYFPESSGPFLQYPPDSWVGWLNRLHALAMLGFSAIALWEIARGWHGDLVASRRALRRWAAMGIGLYALLALVVELAVRGQPVGRLLPALHVAGIGVVAMSLALLVARRSLDDVLGTSREPHLKSPPESATVLPAALPTAEAPVVPDASPADAALTHLTEAMTQARVYRREGLTLAALAGQLGMGEAALRDLINHQLGYRNFNDFLHHYRLNEAVDRLASEDLPVLTIALECGYGSIGPFNRAFRSRMGMTPSEFRGASRLARGARTN
jgi:AraC-like DNA-binding protein